MAHETFTATGRKEAQAIVNAINLAGGEARIGTTYLDYGQNWTWETVIVKGTYSEYQALNPRQFKQMNNGSFNSWEATEIVANATR